MKIRIVSTFILFLSGFIFPQVKTGPIVEIEKRNFLKSESLKKVNYPGDSTIDVTYYRLELNIPPTPHYLFGATTIGLKSTGAGLNGFFLDLQGGLKVDSVTMNNLPLSFTHPDNRININLPKTYNQGEQLFVKVYYQGNPDPSGFGSYIDTSHSGQRIVWTLSEPYGAKDWFACKDTPGDKVDSSDVWVTCPAEMTVASNGTLQQDISNGNGTHTVKWKNHYPIAQYLISIACTNYTLYTNYFRYSTTDSIPITNYVFPENFNDQVKAQIDKTPDMLRIYSQRFGLYPFIKEKYGHAQFLWGGGMEHQTITSLISFDEELVSHELAHQWFGDKVTCADWQDIWLNEGFAEYSSGIYYEDMYGRPRYNSYIERMMDGARNARGSIYVRDISSIGEIFNGVRTYNKGAVVLHMLRGVVGDSAFFKILRTYLADPKLAYGVAVTADFQAAAEKVYGQSLKYFFDEWIFGENYPQYSYTWTARNLQGNTYEVDLNISQKQNTDPSFFTMPVQIKISTQDTGKTLTLMNNAQNQNFIFNVTGKPTDITLDPDNWIIKGVVTPVGNDSTQIKTYSLEQNYPNPFNPVTRLRFQIAGTRADQGELPVIKLKIFDMLGREVVTLIDGVKPAGSYEIEFDASRYNLVSGVYYYQLQAGSYTESKKMVYLK